MKVLKRVLALALTAVLTCGVLGGVVLPQAEAAEPQSLSQLLEDGAIKPLGRTVATTNGILAVWSGCGFEMNVFAPTDTTLTVGYTASHSSYWAVLVDGEQVWRGLAASGTGTFSATIPYGTHTVSVVKETQIDWASNVSHVLTTVAFGGELLAAPENKDLYIEFIGDSYSAGDGALAEFVPGVAWSMVDDSATHGFPWYTAQALNADYSIVARGGIGLFDGTTGDTQQGANPTTTTMRDIYAYTSGFNKTNGEYSFARQPDVVIVELGANDGISTTDATKTITTWQKMMKTFLTLVREKNPNAAIVCIQHNADKYQVLRTLTESGDYGEAYAYYYAHNGNGSSALTTQKEGHPSADDHKEWAKNLVNFLRYNDIVSQQEDSKTYNDIPYYVSETGNDSNDGLKPETAKASVINVFNTLATRTFTNEDRVVIYISGTVIGTTGQSIDNYKKLRVNGKAVPVLITTYQYDAQQDNRAELKLTFSTTEPNKNGARLIMCNDITYQNLRIKSYNTAEKPVPIYQFHSAGQQIVLDNVTFETNVTSGTGSAWYVAADHFSTSGNNFYNATAANPIYSSVTFKNGDYTHLAVVSPTITYQYANDGGAHTNEQTRSKVPNVHCKIVIEDGAVMGTVYGQYDTLVVSSATVEINGGTVEKYIGTMSGTSSTRKTFPKFSTDYTTELRLIINGGTVNAVAGTGNYINYTGNVITTINGGVVHGFRGLGDNMTLTGELNNVITGGRIEVRQTAANQIVYLGGGNNDTVNGNVTNTITGGEIHSYSDAKVTTFIVFGAEKQTVTGALTNKISGGTFAVFRGEAAASEAVIYLGSVTSPRTELLRNEITGGTFYCYSGNICLGGRAVESVYKKVENVIGTQGEPSKAPRFLNVPVYMGGNWGQLGADQKTSTHPAACSDDVVLSNTIYGGYFTREVYAGVAGGTATYYEYIQGSIENNIYGGTFDAQYSSTEENFLGGFYGCSKKGNVFGKVTNNVYGGRFSNFYAAGEDAIVHDGVETNIYAMEDLQICENKKTSGVKGSFVLDIGNKNTGNISAGTPGRAAIKLVLAPENPEDITIYKTLRLNTPETTGTVQVQIKGGKFPADLKLSGVAAEDALAEGSYCLVDGAVVMPEADATTVTGVVTVKSVAAIIGTTPYDSLQDAWNAAGNQEAVKLGGNTTVEFLRINTEKTLDLNGKLLVAQDVLCFGSLIDSADGVGGVVISNDTSVSVMHLQNNNPQLPIYDTDNGCYRFFSYTSVTLGSRPVAEGVTEEFGFRFLLTNAAGYELLKNTEDSGLSVKVELSVGDRLNIPYVYTDAMVKNYATEVAKQVAAGSPVTKVFFITVTGLNSLSAEETLVVTPRVETACGMVMELDPVVWPSANQ